MIKEISAGVIIYRQTKDRRKYLLLHYEEGHFDFPKGHIEGKELPQEAALRELEEETGITHVKFSERFRKKIHYFYKRDGQLKSKEVIFFLASTTQEKITISFEHQGYLWLPYAEALQKITYSQSKNLLKKAEEFLSTKNIRPKS